MTKPFKPLACLVGVALWAAAASAQTISIEPGEWEYNLEGQFGPTAISDDGTDCVSPDEATADLADLIEGLGNDCRLTAFERAGDRLTASVVCTGNLPLHADAEVTMSDGAAEADMTGTLFTDTPAEAPLAMRATARRIGQCSG